MSKTTVSPSARRETRITINWRLVVILLVVGAVGAAIIGWRYQTNSALAADLYYQQAIDRRNDSDWVGEANALYRFLNFNRTDGDAWHALATAYARLAESPTQKLRAIDLHYQAIGFSAEGNPDTLKLHERLAELLLETNRLDEAIRRAEQADTIAQGNSPIAARVLAIARYRRDRTMSSAASVAAAADKLVKSLDLDPADVELATLTARTLREETGADQASLDRQIQADRIMDKLVAAEENQSNASAWLARFAYRRDFGLDGAEDDLEQAIKFQDDDPTRLNVGLAALDWASNDAAADQERWRKEGIGSLENVLNDAEKNIRAPLAYVRLGDAYLQQGGDGAETNAIETWERGAKNNPDQAFDLHARLTRLYLARGNPRLAEEQLEKARKQVVAAARLLSGSRSQRAQINLENSVEVLDARLQLMEGRPKKAIELVKNLIINPNSQSQRERLLHYNVYDVQGKAHQELREWDRAAEAFRKAEELGIDRGQAALNAADLLRQQGRLRQAVEVMEGAAKRLNNQNLWMAAAELRYVDELSEPPGRREWEDFDTAMDRIEAGDAPLWRVKFWQAARAFVTPDERAKALQLAIESQTEAEQAENVDSRYWLQLALMFQDLGEQEKSDEAKNRFDAMAEPWQVSALSAQLSDIRSDSAGAIDAAELAASQAPPENAYEQQRNLVNYYLNARREDDAYGKLSDLRKQFPQDADVVALLADIDLAKGRTGELPATIEALRKIEGEQGIYWRYYQARLLQKQRRDTGIVSELQKQIEDLRPDWAPGYMLKGDIFSRIERPSQAADSYIRAIELGNRNIPAYELLLSALYQANRYDDAVRYMNELQEINSEADRLISLSTRILRRADRIPEAIKRAKQAVKERPDDGNARIWLAQLLAINGQDKEAEDALKRTVIKGRQDLDPWLALFHFYLARNEDTAKRVLEKIQQRDDANEAPAQRALLLGQSWELLGHTDKAAVFYRKAMEADPENTLPRLLLAKLVFTSDPDAAEYQLRRVLKIDPDSEPARQMLATLLGVNGEKWEEVQKLLSPILLGEKGTQNDERIRALLFIQRGGMDNFRQAREILEPMVAETTATITDKRLLAHVYEYEGNLEAAEEQYSDICHLSPLPIHFEAIVGFLLRNGDQTVAINWVGRMDEATEAGTLIDRMRFMNSKARWLASKDRRQEIEPLLETFGEQKRKSLENDELRSLYTGLGQIYMSVQMHESAEKWYRLLMEANKQSYRPLAVTLGHLDKHPEAIDLVIRNHRQDANPRQRLDSLINVLSAGTPADAAWKKTEPFWAAAENDATGEPIIRMYASAARAVQGRQADAIRIMTNLHREQPNNVLVLNNLATLLAPDERRQSEALRYIDQAIGIAGDRPTLLDTKSLILVEMGRPEEAVQILNHLAAMPRPDPLVLFRLGVAHMRSGNAQEAAGFLNRALAEGLESQLLTIHDQQLLTELKALKTP